MKSLWYVARAQRTGGTAMTPGSINDKPKTYKHKRPDGSIVRITVPEDSKPEELLIDALRDNLSPKAVAAIAFWLQPASTNDENVNREVRWFAEQLAQALGGWDCHGRDGRPGMSPGQHQLTAVG
jgi:hypothetical protein